MATRRYDSIVSKPHPAQAVRRKQKGERTERRVFLLAPLSVAELRLGRARRARVEMFAHTVERRKREHRNELGERDEEGVQALERRVLGVVVAVDREVGLEQPNAAVVERLAFEALELEQRERRVGEPCEHEEGLCVVCDDPSSPLGAVGAVGRLDFRFDRNATRRAVRREPAGGAHAPVQEAERSDAASSGGHPRVEPRQASMDALARHEGQRIERRQVEQREEGSHRFW
mmetsp:Transcript_11962/g.21196  ORF Transcript_11962/g.21196 Transcript_11962/m.21196 type:complete len:231 (+) Transcript_11962:1354-2046(+)